MRIALLLCGEARSFVKPSVHLSIRYELLDGLKTKECESDVYWYFSETPVWSGATWSELTSMFEPVRIAVHENSLNKEKEDSVSCFSPCTKPELPKLNGVQSTFKFYQDPSQAIQAAREQYIKIAAGFRLVLEEELRYNFRYDWIIRARFDVGWYNRPPSLLRFSNDRIHLPSQTWNGANDQFALVPRHLANKFFAFDQIFSCHNKTNLPLWWHTFHNWSEEWYKQQDRDDSCSSHSQEYDNCEYSNGEVVWQPESILWAHLRLHGLRFARHSLPAAVVRQNGESRCLELAPHVLLGTLVDAAYQEDNTKNTTLSSFQSLAKTAHVAACAKRFPCCRIDLNTGNKHVFFDVPPHDGQALEIACTFGNFNCRDLKSQLRIHSVLTDDSSVLHDLEVLLQRRETIYLRTRPPVAFSVETAYDTQISAKVVLIESATLADLWDALICTYMHFWPRAEALAAKDSQLTPLLDLDCTGLSNYLLASERWLHDFLDDSSLTWPPYDSLITGHLGWKVRSLSSRKASALLADYHDANRPPTSWNNTTGLIPLRSTWSSDIPVSTFLGARRATSFVIHIAVLVIYNIL